MNKISTAFPSYIQDITLADPSYGTPSKNDLILGAEVYGEIILPGLEKGTPLAQETELGWILSGQIAPNHGHGVVYHVGRVTLDSLGDQIEKFREMEEKQDNYPKQWNEEEQYCESLYTETTKRDESGRYVVRLPFRQNPTQFLGRSKHVVGSFLNLERKMKANPDLHLKYTTSMEEFMQLGHAEAVTKSYFRRTIDDQEIYTCYYIPHLAILKEESLTTRTRVVFDASQKHPIDFR